MYTTKSWSRERPVDGPLSHWEQFCGLLHEGDFQLFDSNPIGTVSCSARVIERRDFGQGVRGGEQGLTEF